MYLFLGRRQDCRQKSKGQRLVGKLRCAWYACNIRDGRGQYRKEGDPLPRSVHLFLLGGVNLGPDDLACHVDGFDGSRGRAHHELPDPQQTALIGWRDTSRTTEVNQILIS